MFKWIFVQLIYAKKIEILYRFIIPIMIASGTNIYGNFVRDFEEADEENKKIVCPISLSTPVDDDILFNWLFIPIGNNLYHTYKLDDFKAYFDSFIGHVPDPQKTLVRLNHMKTRMMRQLNLHEDFKKIKHGEINDTYRKQILREILDSWANEKQIDDITKSKMLSVNLKTFDELGLISVANINNIVSIFVLCGMNVGSFLIRFSSLSKDNNDGDFTIFTISYVEKNKKIIENVRFLSLHGVGLYYLTEKVYSGIPVDVLNSGNIKKILEYITMPPKYACVLDMLQAYIDAGLLNPKKFIVSK